MTARARSTVVQALAALAVATAALALTLAISACGPNATSATSSPSAAAVVVTFEVADDERFKVLLTDPADIKIARQLLAGDDVPSIPNGRIVHETGVNTGYSWSLDPNDIEFADVTTEVCDGLPSDVEAGVNTSDRYCPWSAEVVAIDPAP
jgi:hypothetical protein